MHNLLRQWHVMIGCDFHNEVTATIPPVPAPMIPHVAGHVMNGWWLAATTEETVKALGTKIILRDSDISAGIPHVPIPPYPPCALLLLIIPMSGSKCYFGPSSVLAGGKPIACALIIVVNINLNCADPCGMPLNVVITWGNVVCGMSIGDILGGLLAMGIDAAITFAFNRLGSWLGAKFLGKIINPFFNKLAEGLLSGLVQQLTGSPLGYTNAPLHYLFGDNASVGNWGSLLGHGLGEWIGDAGSTKTIEQLLGAPSPSSPQTTLASPAGTPSSATPATNGIVNDAGVEEH